MTQSKGLFPKSYTVTRMPFNWPPENKRVGRAHLYRKNVVQAQKTKQNEEAEVKVQFLLTKKVIVDFRKCLTFCKQ